MEEEKEYHIVLASYYPNNETKGKKMGDYLGGVSRGTLKMSYENAEKDARQMWIDWTKKFPGCMIEIWIHEAGGWPPKVGPKGSLMYADNFKHFRPGSKAVMGTPF